MGKEQDSERQGESDEGLFACVERWWGRLPIAVRLSSIPFLLIGLVVAWFCISPDFAQFLGYVVGGVFLLWQIFISSQRAKAAEETARAMQKTAELTEKGNIAERFKNAIEHLGHESVSIRLGGIYALHHIAQEVEEYRERILEILCAHVRVTTTQEGYKPKIGLAGEDKPSAEIQAILNLLFCKIPGREIYNRIGADLVGANLQGAKLWFADLQKVYCWGIKLEGADLLRANLQGTALIFANLQKAYLLGVNLQNSFLGHANLQDALVGRANLQEASLDQTNLQGVDLSNVENLQVEQLSKAKTLYKATLPDWLEEGIRQQNPELLEKPKDKKH